MYYLTYCIYVGKDNEETEEIESILEDRKKTTPSDN